MKKATILLLLFVSAFVFAQEKTDKVYFLNGDVLEVEIKKIDTDKIEYVFPNESFSNTASKSKIQKIQFKSGRVQNFNEVKEAPKSLKKAIIKNKVAILPIPFIKQADGSVDSDQKARLAQSKVYNFLVEHLGNIHPRTLQTPRQTNALLRKAGVKISDLDQMSMDEIENFLGVEYVITGRIDYVTKTSQTSESASGGKINTDDDDIFAVGGTVKHTSQNTRYNYTVYIDLYQKEDNIYSKNRQPFFDFKNSWQDSFEYMLKRMPIYNR